MTTSGDSDTPAPTTSVSRRGLLAAGGAVAATSVGVAAGYALAGQPTEPAAAPEADDSLVPFHGPHQAGIATQPQTHAAFLAFDLRGATDRAAAVRLMKLLTDDARRLTAATPDSAEAQRETSICSCRYVSVRTSGSLAYLLPGAAWLVRGATGSPSQISATSSPWPA